MMTSPRITSSLNLNEAAASSRRHFNREYLEGFIPIKPLSSLNSTGSDIKTI
jgi:hypothetical protein